MPELPEVETIVRGLAKRVSGDVIESVWLGQKPEVLKSPAQEIAAALEGSRIPTVRRDPCGAGAPFGRLKASLLQEKP